MININWQPLQNEFQQWRDVDMILPIWWRDDDAIAPTPALDMLDNIACDTNIPVHLAIIPKLATPALADHIHAMPNVIPVVHGWAHQNHEPQGIKKAEFGATRPIETCIEDAKAGLDLLKNMFGTRLKPMFVPPWNRINPDINAHLAMIGYTNLSTYSPRKSRQAAIGLTQINTHLDPIAWHDGRGLVAPDILISEIVKQMQDRRLGRADNTEPFGLLTHHLVHDQDISSFIQQFLTIMQNGPTTIYTIP